MSAPLSRELRTKYSVSLHFHRWESLEKWQHHARKQNSKNCDLASKVIMHLFWLATEIWQLK